jgi:hypothetical protein
MNANTTLSIVNLNETGTVKPVNPYVAALTLTKPMYELEVKDRKAHLLACIQTAIFIGGWQQKHINDLILIVQLLMPEINGRLKLMTEAEVRLAFENGAKGYYGENKGGLSIVACIGWLDAYYLDAKRLDAKKRVGTTQIGDHLSVADLSNLERRSTIQTAYTKFLTHGSYHDYGNLIYNLLDKEGLLSYSTQEKKAFVELGRKSLYAKLQFANNLQERRDNDRKIEELMNSDVNAIVEAKRIALLDYFVKAKLQDVVKIVFH